MSGHALNVCKFAQQLQASEFAKYQQPSLAAEIDKKVAQLIAFSPSAATALDAMLSALLEDLTLLHRSQPPR